MGYHDGPGARAKLPVATDGSVWAKKKVMEPMVKWVLLPENIDVIRGNLYMLGHIMGNLNLWHVKIMIMICLILET